MADRPLQRPYLRPIIALALFTVEYLLVSFLFDAARLKEVGGALGVLGWLGLAGPALVAFGTGLWMLSGTQIREALVRPLDGGSTRLWPSLLLQLLCFALFLAATDLLFMGDLPAGGGAPFWIALWLVAGSATALSLVFVALSGRRPLSLTGELAAPVALATLVAFAALGAGLATLELWDPLSAVTLYAVAWTLQLVAPSVYFDAATAEIGTKVFWVRVAPVCSGYEGIGLILVLLSAYMVAFRKQLRFPNVLILIPAAIVLMWLLNVLRIVALILLGHFWSPNIAIGGFHSKAGWLLFCGVALWAVWVSQRVAWFASEPTERRHATVNPSAPFLLPLLAVVATTMINGLFIDDFDYLYPLRVVVAILVLAWYRDDYLAGLRHHLRGRPIFSWHAVGLGVAAYVLWTLVSLLGGPAPSTGPPEALKEMTLPLAIAWTAARVLGSTVIVPIVEELAFRGFLLRRLIGRDFTKVPYEQWRWPAVLISSLAFAALHQQWLGGFGVGLLYAYAQKRRGLLSDAIVAHSVTNGLIAVEVLAGGNWSLW